MIIGKKDKTLMNSLKDERILLYNEIESLNKEKEALLLENEKLKCFVSLKTLDDFFESLRTVGGNNYNWHQLAEKLGITMTTLNLYRKHKKTLTNSKKLEFINKMQ